MRVDPSAFTLSDAQLVVARGYGFASWPRLKHYLEIASDLRRDPVDARPRDDVERFCDLACLQYSEADEPARWADAADLLGAQPDLPSRSIHAAAAAGDHVALRRHLDTDSEAGSLAGGPFRWVPLLYLVYSRIPQRNAVARPGCSSTPAPTPPRGISGRASPRRSPR
jgi:hypothetical protein